MKYFLLLIFLSANICNAANTETAKGSSKPNRQLNTSKKCGFCGNKATQKCSSCDMVYYCSREHQKHAWTNHKTDCLNVKRHKQLKKVEIKDSLIEKAGLGLFASADFEYGDVLALYYGEYQEENLRFNAFNNPYQYKTQKGDIIIGESNPTITPFLAGPFVNDPYMKKEWFDDLLKVDCSNFDNKKIKTIAKNYLKNHYKKYGPKQNVELLDGDKYEISNYPGFYAKRKIKKGEEIYWPYGLNYWMSIPESICMRKGFPLVSLGIKKIIIESLNELPQNQNDIKKMYMPNTQGLNLDEDRKNMSSENNKILFQLSALLGRYSTIQLEVEDLNLFKKMLVELGIEESLKEIAELPNSEFYNQNLGILVHPRAKRTIKKMIEWQEEKKEKIFNFVDMKKQQTLHIDVIKNEL